MVWGKSLKGQVWLFGPDDCYQIFMKLSSFSFQSLYFVASIIQLLLFIRSYFSFPAFFLFFEIRWDRPPIFFCVSLLVFVFWCKCLAQDASQILFWSIFYQVGRLFFLAIRNFNLPCVSIKHGIHCFSIFYSVSLIFFFFWKKCFDPFFFIFSGVYFFIDIFPTR